MAVTRGKRRRLAHATKLLLSGNTFKLLLQWLSPQDILFCLQTCKQWRNEIDDDVWIAVAKNISPLAVSVIENTKMGRMLDYRSIALTLIRKRVLVPDPDLTIPEPKLRLQENLVRYFLSSESVRRSHFPITTILSANFFPSLQCLNRIFSAKKCTSFRLRFPIPVGKRLTLKSE